MINTSQCFLAEKSFSEMQHDTHVKTSAGRVLQTRGQ